MASHNFEIRANRTLLGSWTLEQGVDDNGEPTFNLKTEPTAPQGPAMGADAPTQAEPDSTVPTSGSPFAPTVSVETVQMIPLLVPKEEPQTEPSDASSNASSNGSSTGRGKHF